MVETSQIVIACSIFCVVFITSCALLGSSFDTLEPNEMGIVFDHNVQHLGEDQVYLNGRYLVGLGREFINFPRTYQTVRYGQEVFDPATAQPTIVCRSNDGLAIEVEISFQYLISRNVSDLWRLYMDFGGSFSHILGLVAEQTVQDVFGDYQTLDFFTDRVQIESDIANQLRTKFIPFYVSVPSVELMGVNIVDNSPTLVDAIEQTLVAVQDVFVAAAEQAVAQVQADALVGVATEVAAVQLLNANATAISYLATVQANADALLYRVDRQATALLELRESLGLNTSLEVLSYNWLTAVQENSVPDVIFGFQYPQLLQKVFAAS